MNSELFTDAKKTEEKFDAIINTLSGLYPTDQLALICMAIELIAKGLGMKPDKLVEEILVPSIREVNEELGETVGYEIRRVYDNDKVQS